MKSSFAFSLILVVALCTTPVVIPYAWSKDVGSKDAADQASKEVLGAKTWKRVRDHVMPDKQDLVWTQVGWHPTLWDAVIAAHKAKKPILLWAMNGHALACT